MDTGDYPPYDPRKASADSFNDSDQPASEASNPTSTASSVSQNSLLSSSATGGVIKTDPKQMLLKLNLLKLYPLFQKHHIDGSNLHELASSDKLKVRQDHPGTTFQRFFYIWQYVKREHCFVEKN